MKDKDRMIVARGTFSGTGGHVLEGDFILIRSESGITMQTSENFLFDGSPEPGWALFNGKPNSDNIEAVARAAKETRFGCLAPLSEYPFSEVRGPQLAFIPGLLDISRHTCVILWCFRTPFLLGFGSYALVHQETNS